MNKKLNELLVRADSACQNEEWVRAYELLIVLRGEMSISGIMHSELFIFQDSGMACMKLREKKYTEAHDLIKDLLQATYDPSDPLYKPLGI